MGTLIYIRIAISEQSKVLIDWDGFVTSHVGSKFWTIWPPYTVSQFLWGIRAERIDLDAICTALDAYTHLHIDIPTVEYLTQMFPYWTIVGNYK